MTRLSMDHGCHRVLAPAWHRFETTVIILSKVSRTLSWCNLWSVANLEKILMHRNAIPSVLRGEVGPDVPFHVFPSGRGFNIEQVEHELSDGVGLVQIWCLDVRRFQRCHDVILVSVLSPEGLGGLAQFKPVAEKVMHHVHAPALAMLQHHDSYAGWRHPGYETF
jgi:hypothetical protein